MIRLLSRIPYHFRYLSFAAGRRVRFGNRHFRMQGYFPNQFYARRSFEPHLERLISVFLRERQGAFVDVGTNVGQTLAKVLAADPDRQYVGFEPQIACAFYIDEFLRKNGIETAQVLPVALGEKMGFLTLHTETSADEMASMDRYSPRAEGSGRKRVLPVLRGDAVLDALSIERVAIIKIDVEGAELSVIRGLEGTLRRERPVLFFEVLPTFTGEERLPVDPRAASIQWNRATELFSLLSALGYRVYQIRGDGSYFPIEKFEIDDPKKWIGRDYLAINRESGVPDAQAFRESMAAL